MEIQPALVSQIRAGLAMLRQCVEKCPEDLWVGGDHPRCTWRIAYHAAFYTHFYLARDVDSFTPWARHRKSAMDLWGDPPVETPYTREEILEYLARIDSGVEAAVGALDLSAPECGFPWYRLSKQEHLLVNLRHLGGHVGQLSERLMARGIDVDWVGAVSG